jgi:hypothetical protein
MWSIASRGLFAVAILCLIVAETSPADAMSSDCLINPLMCGCPDQKKCPDPPKKLNANPTVKGSNKVLPTTRPTTGGTMAK